MTAIFVHDRTELPEDYPGPVVPVNVPHTERL